jgi:hypothetical protein
MTSRPDDETLQRMVGAVLDCVDPEPPGLRALAYQAMELRGLREGLAALEYDSALESDLVVTRSGEGPARLLSFVNEHLSLDVSLLPDGASIVGQIAPVDADELTIETGAGARITVPVDELGRFRAQPGRDTIRLRVVGRLVTPWITP